MSRLFCMIAVMSASAFLGAQQKPAREVIDLFRENLTTITDYQCRMYEWSILGRKQEIRYINFYFRSPRLIRMDIIRGNRSGDTGSIGVLREDGKVRGRKGGILSPFAVTVNKNSSLATTIRGVTFDESDALAAYDRMKYLLENSRYEMSEDSTGWLFEFTLNIPENNITREVLFLSSQNLMPVFTKSYEGNTLVQFVQWRSYLINSGLPVEFFDVRYKAEKLDDLFIPNNLHLPLDLKE
jgi:hypothetical protein